MAEGYQTTLDMAFANRQGNRISVKDKEGNWYSHFINADNKGWENQLRGGEKILVYLVEVEKDGKTYYNIYPPKSAKEKKEPKEPGKVAGENVGKPDWDAIQSHKDSQILQHNSANNATHITCVQITAGLIKNKTDIKASWSEYYNFFMIHNSGLNTITKEQLKAIHSINKDNYGMSNNELAIIANITSDSDLKLDEKKKYHLSDLTKEQASLLIEALQDKDKIKEIIGDTTPPDSDVPF